MFDISGTMLLVYWMFIYGLKSVWIPWLWPTFNQIFLMVYLSAWLRRSNVMTGAEWIKTRFGTGRGAQLSHLIVVVYAFVSIIGFFTYGFKGIGKFAAEFMPWHLSPNVYALILIAITAIYVIKGGMISVLHPVHRLVCRGYYRHDEGGAGYAAQGGARRVGQHVLWLALESRLVHIAPLSQR
jgi:Na+/proline symporter